MKDMLTTFSSIIIILFCFSLFYVSDEAETNKEKSAALREHNARFQHGQHPLAKTKMFTRVQSVSLKKGILMFVTSDPDGLNEHFFLLRDKNVILAKKPAIGMPRNSIKFEDDGHNTLVVTIPDSFDIDLLTAMSSD
ncbi:hypothetical protein [Gimesia aquarii]|nr:hypothetical protein [Gimesia aquarii]